MKDTDEQPDEEIHRLEASGKGQSFHITCSSAWKLSKPCTWDLGIFMQSSSYGHDQSLIPFIALLPSQETGGRADHPKLLLFFPSQASNHDLFFL